MASDRSFAILETPEETAQLVLQILKRSRISLQEQRDRNLLNLDNESPELSNMINDLINKYPDIKTCLTLTELWLPSSRSRAKSIPRAQNHFFLFRRDISRGLCNADNSLTVSDASKVISILYKSLTSHESEFWKQFGMVVRKKHESLHPDYRFTPIRVKKSGSQTFNTNYASLVDLSSAVSTSTTITTNEDLLRNRHVRKQESSQQSQNFEDSGTSSSVNAGTRSSSTITTNKSTLHRGLKREETSNQQARVSSVRQSSSHPNIVIPSTQPAIIAQQNAMVHSIPSQFINSSGLISQQQQQLNLYFSTGPTQYYREFIPPIPITQRIYSQQTPHPQFVTSTLIMTAPQQSVPSRSPLLPTVGTEFYYPIHDDLILLSQSLGLDGSSNIDPNLFNSSDSDFRE